MKNSKNIIIIGAGPAGIATAIQLKRYHIEPVLLEQEAIGGLLRNANWVENYPGFPGGIRGLDLVALFEKHLNTTGVRVHFEKVINIEYKDNLFSVTTNLRSIPSFLVVIATGTKPRKPSKPRIPSEIDDRVVYEVHSIRKAKNKKIAIIGAGDAAFDYALNVSQDNEVLILNRGNRTSCIPALQEKCTRTKNIQYIKNIQVSKIEKEAQKLLLTCTGPDTQMNRQIMADYLIIAVGREPRLDFLSGELKKHFEILIQGNRLYVVGDVQNDIYRQTAICVGDGMKTAMKIDRILRRETP